MSRLPLQQGMVLLLALIMLLLLTLLATASITSNTIASQLVRHDQRQLAVNRAVENTINYVVTDADYFINYQHYLNADGQFSVPLPAELSDKFVTTEIVGFRCIAEVTAPGCSLQQSPESNLPCLVQYYWQLEVRGVDQTSMASTLVSQGIGFSYLPGYCPI